MNRLLVPLLAALVLSGCGSLGTVEQRVLWCEAKGPQHTPIVTTTDFYISDCFCDDPDLSIPVCPTNRSVGEDCCPKGGKIRMGRNPHTGAQLACALKTVSHVDCLERPESMPVREMSGLYEILTQEP